jgi:hypothetical protein
MSAARAKRSSTDLFIFCSQYFQNFGGAFTYMPASLKDTAVAALRHRIDREEDGWEPSLTGCAKARKVERMSSFDRTAQRQDAGIARWKGDYS